MDQARNKSRANKQAKGQQRSANARQLQYQEIPMMLNAWTQTTTDDFATVAIEGRNYGDHNSQTDNYLRERIRILEENLHNHSEILQHMQHSSPSSSEHVKNEVHMFEQQQQQQPQQHHHNQQPQPQPQQVQSHHRVLSNDTSRSTEALTIPMNNTMQQSTVESVNYRIVADGNDGANGEPLEIQIAEDECSLNLNSSAESGPLEICITDDNIEINEEGDEMSEYNDAKRSRLAEEVRHKKIVYFIDSRGFKQFIKGYPGLVNKETISMSSTPDPLPSASKACRQYKKQNKRGNAKRVIKKTKATSSNTSSDVTQSNTSSDATQSNTSSDAPTSDNSINTIESPLSPYQFEYDLKTAMVSIGPGNTQIPATVFDNMSWLTPSAATRKLLMTIFDRETLATHSMTGKPSPAFKNQNKPLKKKLDPLVVRDIIYAVRHKCGASDKEVRTAITTKCADENKMMRNKKNKNKPLREPNDDNKENIINNII